MAELICEEIAHKAGFTVSVGNWIAPNGGLIAGKDYETHHWETIKEHFHLTDDPPNHLEWMNQRIFQDGFIRLVFRSDVLFQVGCEKKEEIWAKIPNVTTMREILSKIAETEIHIFSKTFYIIGLAKGILDKNLDQLEIQEI